MYIFIFLLWLELTLWLIILTSRAEPSWLVIHPYPQRSTRSDDNMLAPNYVQRIHHL
jgi:hypothetical protein